MFSGTQALPENRGAYIRTQNWHVLPVGPTGQTGVVKDHEIQFGLYHWIGLIE
jgi:hypothetical protein